MRHATLYACLAAVIVGMITFTSFAKTEENAAIKNRSDAISPETEYFQLSFPVSTKFFKWYTGVEPDRYLDYTSILDHKPPFYSTSSNLQPYTGENGPTSGSGSDACGSLAPSLRSYCYNGHSGLDIPVASGTALYASHAAEVVRGSEDPSNYRGYGTTVLLRDEDNRIFITLYGHLSQALVASGDHVKRGQRIATSGCTGGCVGAHLHWGLYYDTTQTNSEPHDEQGKVLDPYGWFSRRANPIASPVSVPTDYKWAKGYPSQGFANELPTFDLNEGTLQGHEYINKDLASNGVFKTGRIPDGSTINRIEEWWASKYGNPGPPYGDAYPKAGYGDCQEFEGGLYCTGVSGGNPSYAPSTNFSDVPLTHWAHRYIEWAAREGVISGYADATFKPSNFVTRSQASKIITRAFSFTPTATPTPSMPEFCDVPSTHWAYSYIRTLRTLNIVSGYEAGSAKCNAACGVNVGPCFIPGENITRGQISKMIAESVVTKENLSRYSTLRGPDYWDVPAASGDAFYNSIRLLTDIGVIRYRKADGDPGCTYGSNCDDLGHFFVGWYATRAQVTQLVHESIYSLYCPPGASCDRQ